MSNLRDRDAYGDAAWDWGFLNECFAPSKCRVSDLDGIVERGGHFLVLEGKPAPAKVQGGQAYTFDALVAKGFTVLVLYGNRNEPVAMQHWPNPRAQADEQTIQRFVRSWWEFANGLQKDAAPGELREDVTA